MDLTAKPPPTENFQKQPSSDSQLLLSFTNGSLKRHHHHHHNHNHHHPTKTLYKECLKNHAAAMGFHAIDGCGEFMPSPHSSPSDPTSLKCAACGCHRNFHRRSDDNDEEGDDEDAAQFTPKRRSSSSPPPPLASTYSPSAPQMLLALSAGPAGPADAENNHFLNHPTTPNVNSTMGRKRFRTKFSREQKEKMYDFAEKLGWKMQRQDEGMVEEFCREIGVGRSVLKVWMHNHKHSSFAKRNNSTCNNTESNNTTKNATNAHVVLNASSSSS